MSSAGDTTKTDDSAIFGQENVDETTHFDNKSPEIVSPPVEGKTRVNGVDQLDPPTKQYSSTREDGAGENCNKSSVVDNETGFSTSNVNNKSPEIVSPVNEVDQLDPSTKQDSSSTRENGSSTIEKCNKSISVVDNEKGFSTSNVDNKSPEIVSPPVEGKTTVNVVDQLDPSTKQDSSTREDGASTCENGYKSTSTIDDETGFSESVNSVSTSSLKLAVETKKVENLVETMSNPSKNVELNSTVNASELVETDLNSKTTDLNLKTSNLKFEIPNYVEKNLEGTVDKMLEPSSKPIKKKSMSAREILKKSIEIRGRRLAGISISQNTDVSNLCKPGGNSNIKGDNKVDNATNLSKPEGNSREDNKVNKVGKVTDTQENISSGDSQTKNGTVTDFSSSEVSVRSVLEGDEIFGKGVEDDIVKNDLERSGITVESGSILDRSIDKSEDTKDLKVDVEVNGINDKILGGSVLNQNGILNVSKSIEDPVESVLEADDKIGVDRNKDTDILDNSKSDLDEIIGGSISAGVGVVEQNSNNILERVSSEERGLKPSLSLGNVGENRDKTVGNSSCEPVSLRGRKRSRKSRASQILEDNAGVSPLEEGTVGSREEDSIVSRRLRKRTALRYGEDEYLEQYWETEFCSYGLYQDFDTDESQVLQRLDTQPMGFEDNSDVIEEGFVEGHDKETSRRPSKARRRREISRKSSQNGRRNFGNGSVTRSEENVGNSEMDVEEIVGVREENVDNFEGKLDEVSREFPKVKGKRCRKKLSTEEEEQIEEFVGESDLNLEEVTKVKCRRVRKKTTENGVESFCNLEKQDDFIDKTAETSYNLGKFNGSVKNCEKDTNIDDLLREVLQNLSKTCATVKVKDEIVEDDNCEENNKHEIVVKRKIGRPKKRRKQGGKSLENCGGETSSAGNKECLEDCSVADVNLASELNSADKVNEYSVADVNMASKSENVENCSVAVVNQLEPVKKLRRRSKTTKTPSNSVEDFENCGVATVNNRLEPVRRLRKRCITTENLSNSCGEPSRSLGDTVVMLGDGPKTTDDPEVRARETLIFGETKSKMAANDSEMAARYCTNNLTADGLKMIIKKELNKQNKTSPEIYEESIFEYGNGFHKIRYIIRQEKVAPEEETPLVDDCENNDGDIGDTKATDKDENINNNEPLQTIKDEPIDHHEELLSLEIEDHQTQEYTVNNTEVTGKIEDNLILDQQRIFKFRNRSGPTKRNLIDKSVDISSFVNRCKQTTVGNTVDNKCIINSNLGKYTMVIKSDIPEIKVEDGSDNSRGKRRRSRKGRRCSKIIRKPSKVSNSVIDGTKMCKNLVVSLVKLDVDSLSTSQNCEDLRSGLENDVKESINDVRDVRNSTDVDGTVENCVKYTEVVENSSDNNGSVKNSTDVDGGVGNSTDNIENVKNSTDVDGGVGNSTNNDAENVKDSTRDTGSVKNSTNEAENIKDSTNGGFNLENSTVDVGVRDSTDDAGVKNSTDDAGSVKSSTNEAENVKDIINDNENLKNSTDNAGVKDSTGDAGVKYSTDNAGVEDCTDNAGVKDSTDNASIIKNSTDNASIVKNSTDNASIVKNSTVTSSPVSCKIQVRNLASLLGPSTCKKVENLPKLSSNKNLVKNLASIVSKLDLIARKNVENEDSKDGDDLMGNIMDFNFNNDVVSHSSHFSDTTNHGDDKNIDEINTNSIHNKNSPSTIYSDTNQNLDVNDGVNLNINQALAKTRVDSKLNDDDTNVCDTTAPVSNNNVSKGDTFDEVGTCNTVKKGRMSLRKRKTSINYNENVLNIVGNTDVVPDFLVSSGVENFENVCSSTSYVNFGCVPQLNDVIKRSRNSRFSEPNSSKDDDIEFVPTVKLEANTVPIGLDGVSNYGDTVSSHIDTVSRKGRNFNDTVSRNRGIVLGTVSNGDDQFDIVSRMGRDFNDTVSRNRGIVLGTVSNSDDQFDTVSRKGRDFNDTVSRNRGIVLDTVSNGDDQFDTVSNLEPVLSDYEEKYSSVLENENALKVTDDKGFLETVRSFLENENVDEEEEKGVKVRKKRRRRCEMPQVPSDLKCEICGKVVSTRQSYRHHISTHTDPRKQLLKCSVCNKMLAGERRLKSHITNFHTNINIYSCDFCKKIFHDKGNLYRHIVHVHLNMAPMYTCDICKKSFQKKSYLQQHINLHMGIRKHVCNLCGKNYMNKSDLQNHLDAHVGFDRYVCGVCGKRLSCIQTMNNHMKTHTQENMFKCKVCGKQYASKNSLQQHMNLHTGKRFTCGKCGAKFAYREGYKRHMRSHDGKQQKCNVCHKVFQRKTYLKKHMTIHTGMEQFMCVYCGKKFIDKSDYNKHMNTHTHNEKFPCEFCGKVFHNKQYYVMHKKMHTGDTEHVCKYCNKKFMKRNLLERHESIHEGTNFVACEVCGAVLSSVNSCRRHMRNKHGWVREICEEVGSGQSV